MDKPSESILAKLAWQHASFTRAEKRITDYILSNKTAAQYMTISELAEKSGVEMPICRCAYEVLYQGQSVQQVLERLMGRSKRHEVDESWI